MININICKKCPELLKMNGEIIIYCTKNHIRNKFYSGRGVIYGPPKKCPYWLEHVASNDNELHQKIKCALWKYK